MFKKVAFTCFPVRDPLRARAFYEDVLGLVRGSASSDGVWTEYDLPGGGCLALFGAKGAGGADADADAAPAAAGGASIAFEVEDLDALNVRLKAAGVTYKHDMVHSPVCRMSFITDSEGNGIILHELHKHTA